MSEQTPSNSRLARAKLLLNEVAESIQQKPFHPHPVFKSGHAQTLAAYAWPRRYRFSKGKDEERYFDVAPNARVLAHCRWQNNRNEHPTIVLWHGIEGSSSSVYMLALAAKGFGAGFNVIRMNLRNCGGTEHLTPTLYHGGLSEDLRVVVNELIETDQISNLILVGISLGGNMVLKLAAEYASNPPPQVLAVAAVSPSVDLDASAEMICKRSNWLYHRDFVRRLKKRIRRKKKLFPELYDISELDLAHTIRDFDDRYTAPAHGFKDAADYYDRASAGKLLDRIELPTLIIHALDDPFIPFAPLKRWHADANPFILLVGTERGGHVAFISEGDNSHSPQVGNDDRSDRFWAENRLIDFCRIVARTT